MFKSASLFVHAFCRLVVVHRDPKYIQVSWSTMCAQLLGDSEMELDLFDALVRVVRPEDDMRHACYGTLWFCHFYQVMFFK